MQNLKTHLFKTKHPSWMLFVVAGILTAGIGILVLGDGKVATQLAQPQPSQELATKQFQPEEPVIEYLSNELLIKIRSPQHKKIKQNPTPEDTGLSSLNKLNKEQGVTKFERIAKPSKKSKDPNHEVFRWYKITLSGEAEILREFIDDDTQIKSELFLEDLASEQLRKSKIQHLKSVREKYNTNPDIENIEFNYIARTFFEPNDPLYSQQWAHQNTDSESAWDITMGDPNIRIAIVDTGVDYRHEDLSVNIWHDADGNPGWDAVDINTAAYTSSGYSLLPSEDYSLRDNDPADYYGHGTHVAGIAAAQGNNSKGVVGVCPNCDIMPVRAGFAIAHPTYGEVGLLEHDDIQSAITYAADNGAHVVNMSFGGSGSQAMQDAINYAYARGVTLVAAAGNSNSSSKSYPAGYNNVIAVGATAGDDSKAYYSNYGCQWIDVAAPGGDARKDSMIISTVPVVGTLSDPSGYRSLQGTSMASPYVAGLAGLVASHLPGLTADEIQLRIAGTTDDIGSFLPDLAGWFGSGRVNVFKALGEPVRPNVIVDWLGAQDNNGQWISQGWIAPGDTETMSIRLRNTWLDVTNITATLSSDGPYVVVTSGFSSFGNLGQGQMVTGVEKYIFSVSDLAPIGETVRFQLDVRGDGYQKLLSLAFTIRFPFQDGFPIATSAFLNYGAAATITDLEGDGRKEAIFIDSANIYVVDDLGRNKPGWPQAISSSSVPAIGDIDNDGVQEIVAVSCPDNCTLMIWKVDGIKIFSSTPYPSDWDRLGRGLSAPTLADLDRDGDLEILFGVGMTLHTVHHTGESVAGSWPVYLDTIFYINPPAVGDLDNNGELEIIAAGFRNYAGGRNRVVVLNNQGAEVWSKELSGGIVNSPALADVDGDGKLEIFLASNKGFLHVWRYDGSELFPVVELAKDLGLSSDWIKASLALGDVDGNGDLEIVVGDYDGRRVYVYHHDGTPLAGWPIQHTAVGHSSPVLADLDGDGRQDIIIGGFGFDATKLSAWRYDGSVVDGFPIDLRTIPSNTNWLLDFVPAIEDLDGDGDIELAMPIQASSYRFLVFDLPWSYNQKRMQWPAFHHDNQRTGRFTPVDTDGDGFNDLLENLIGTDRFRACGPNAWPPDFNDDGIVQIDDVSFVAGKYGKEVGDPGYTPRAELASQDGVIQIDDVSKVSGLFGRSCLP